jgi:hypothetical protein
MSEDDKRAYRKGRLIQELIQSEENYIGTLRVIEENIREPASGIIGQELAGRLFPVASLLRLNEALLQELRTASARQQFGSSILVIIHYFKLYIEFFQNYMANEECLRRLIRENKRFRTFVEARNYSEEWKRLDLFGLYSQPFQRPSKYDLFFRDILKCTPADHPDHGSLATILQQFRQVNEHNDESLGKIVNEQRLAELELEYGDIVNNFSRESIRVYVA